MRLDPFHSERARRTAAVIEILRQRAEQQLVPPLTLPGRENVVPALKCTNCGLTYGRTAPTHDLLASTGAACPRCSSPLGPVVVAPAVRSGVRRRSARRAYGVGPR
jgi:DNA-directed RNA polymerase subunit RPC12/RpoP